MEQGGQGSVWPSLFSFLRPELKLGPILTLRPKGKVQHLWAGNSGEPLGPQAWEREGGAPGSWRQAWLQESDAH